jgi:hypothetical protein
MNRGGEIAVLYEKMMVMTVTVMAIVVNAVRVAVVLIHSVLHSLVFCCGCTHPTQSEGLQERPVRVSVMIRVDIRICVQVGIVLRLDL